MHIEALSPATVNQAINLVNEVFPRQPLLENANWAFRASLIRNSIIAKIVFKIKRITELRYWVAVDEDSNKVVGTTGLYSYSRATNEAYWLGWTCVSPNIRGQGVGSKLVDFSIEKARSEGKKFLRLYTSNSPDQEVARILYNKRGFQLTGKDEIQGSKFKKLYYELKL